jgi:hypothetical protein
MNLIFHENLDDFFFIYIDDIFMYTKIVEEHVGHLQYVLRKLTKNQFFVNHSNNEFVLKEVNFLGHALSWTRVRPNPRKLKAIRCWQRLVMSKGIRSFLGLANFY